MYIEHDKKKVVKTKTIYYNSKLFVKSTYGSSAFQMFRKINTVLVFKTNSICSPDEINQSRKLNNVSITALARFRESFPGTDYQVDKYKII
jgi:hypothetical protein